MRADFLRILAEETNRARLPDFLAQTSYDELIEFDPVHNQCRNIEHAEGKYFVPVMIGTYSALYDYAADHMIHPEDRQEHLKLMEPDTILERLRTAPFPGFLDAEMRYRTLEGQWRWTWQLVIDGEMCGRAKGTVLCYVYDIEKVRQRESGEIDRLPARPSIGARRDELTGLFQEKDFFALARDKMHSIRGEWCMIAVDIEHFKLFQEWHGLETGRFLLARYGEILHRAEEEENGLAGYRGQDDFCLMMPYDEKKIDKLYNELKDVIVSLSHTVGFLPLFGICKMTDPKEQILDVFNHAALTAEELKGNIHERVRVYDPEVHRKNTDEYRLLTEFQRAFANHELFFYLQPQCHVFTRKVVGAESLARWRKADGSWVSPAVFIPILEKYGIVTNLDQFIWESVCQWLRGWIDAGHRPVPISVNISQVDVFTIDVPEYLLSLVKKYGLKPELLKIEFTESAYVEDTSAVKRTVKRLREMGFLVLMDDFGSGYSSLNMLHALNVDVIKLDAQFLHIGQEEEKKGVSIVESVIGMTKTMATPVIVEGVETAPQVQFMADLGCQYMQGFYFYHPMPVKDFEKLIADEARLDLRGFEFKANQEMHVREFMDESRFSDSMLNRILGPVAFFNWHDGHVDIVRYNQQFYQMMGASIEQVNRRSRHVEESLVPEDQEKLFALLERAARDRINGAEGQIRFAKSNGSLIWLRLQAYYLDEDEHGKQFYISCEDVTEMQYINADIPGGYYRCAMGNDFELLYISENFRKMVGYTSQEIKEQFDNKLINMVHPNDRALLIRQAGQVDAGDLESINPYRIRRKGEDYIYVADQCRVTDLFGAPCWQAVLIDVTEVMKLRNQMRLLARFSSDSLLFIRKSEKGMWPEVVVHGLEKRLGLDKAAFQRALEDESFYTWLENAGEEGDREIQAFFAGSGQTFEREFFLRRPDGERLRLHMKIDRVSDETTSAAYICVLREA